MAAEAAILLQIGAAAPAVEAGIMVTELVLIAAAERQLLEADAMMGWMVAPPAAVMVEAAVDVMASGTRETGALKLLAGGWGCLTTVRVVKGGFEA